MSKSIVLTGLSGAGKSTTGPMIAKRLGLSFIDLDECVESLAGMTVAELFESFGEAHFRSLESQALQTVLESREARVIASGGGALVDDANRRLAIQHSIVVWLNVTPEIALERTRQDVERPLLATTDPLEVLNSLLSTRKSAYGEAAIVVDTDGQTPNEVASRIVDALIELGAS